MLFSAVAVNLNKVGFNFTTDQLFMLTALPSVSGALLRVPYSFVIPVFGGRRWTAISTLFLIVPCLWLGIVVQDSTTSYGTFVLISLLCGFAGANFASSMANISFFFPKAKQGGALGPMGIRQPRRQCDAIYRTYCYLCGHVRCVCGEWLSASRW